MRHCSIARAGWLTNRSSRRLQSAAPSSSASSAAGSSRMIRHASRPISPMAGVSTATVTTRKIVLSAATVTGVIAASMNENGRTAFTA